MNEFLLETESIDYNNPIIQEKVLELKKQSSDKLDYIEASKRAREALIGEQKVTNVEIHPFSVTIDENLIEKK
jgi:hypothetical protein